jgi:UDP-N-acetylglucosamine 2-epimerase (hydrolysing)
MNEENYGKKILFVSGTRADFGKIKPLIQQIKDSEDFSYQIFVTGMHMLSVYGLTVHEIRKAGFDNIYSFINQDSAITSQMDLVLSTTVQGLAYYVREYKPDLLVVHGDRVESLAGAIVGALNNILVAHIEGGERSGTIDELIRHAITKLSHIHFVSNNEARNRLVQMGEIPSSIFAIGSPDIDIMLSDQLPTLPAVKEKYSIPFQEYYIFIYHPVTTELQELAVHIQEAVNALIESRMNYVIIYPNNDVGADIIMQGLKSLEENPNIRMIPSMRFEHFLVLLRNARAILGNSSVGIREAPVYGVPTINIGTRQLNRYEYPSIINVDTSKKAILEALRKLPHSVKPSLHFGKGDSAKSFLKELRNDSLWKTSRQKQFIDFDGVDPLKENDLVDINKPEA